MQPVTYLFFNSGCRDAMTRYGEIFGSTPEIMTHGTLPASERAGMPPVPDDTVMHSALKIGEGWIYGSDDFSGNSPAMAGCNIALSLPDEAETRRVWDALSDGAEIRMPLTATFFAPLFGMLTDRFGIRWMILQDSAHA
ncbi:MAG: VOC family protein [Rhodobacteraceae bacterium]|nr:VOC family protein [Paracoccaceae bacterium]MAY44041.1 VOC family protein [Paracoccaceae bacterium]